MIKTHWHDMNKPDFGIIQHDRENRLGSDAMSFDRRANLTRLKIGGIEIFWLFGLVLLANDQWPKGGVPAKLNAGIIRVKRCGNLYFAASGQGNCWITLNLNGIKLER